jgi:uncharacterized repeat protein (TIGR01451 family)
MGTRKMQQRRNRRGRVRGFAPFVAFALLFAFALGQGSSLMAFAFDNSGAGPTVSKDGSAPTGDDSSGGGSTADGGTTKVSGSGPAATSSDSGSTSTRRVGAGRNSGDAGGILAIEPGGVNLDFVAAGPFTYNHDTGLGAYPDFGYNDRTIDKDSGVVESLEGGDFECNDLVTFFVEVEVEAGAGSGDVELDLSFGNETTGQPGLGFDDIVSYGINTPDDGNVGLDGTETVVLSNEHIETAGYDQLRGTFTVTGLEGGETAILRVTVHLECGFGTPTGNILNAIEAARADGKTINIGQETVPMKQLADVAQPGLNVNKTCPPTARIGDTITYEIDIINTGNEPLDIQSVMDTVNGHAAVDITSNFAASVAAGATISGEYEYTVLASDPDPLPNSVTVTAEGQVSEQTLTGTATCETDIVHVPGIDVTKSCPAAVADGADIEYTITVENTGDEALTGVKVTDTLLGDITGDFNFNFANPFPAGATATATVTYEQQAGDPDPITNTVTAEGTGADSGVKATDTASCTTDITHVPGIAVTKTCPAQAGEGDTVTYTITVSNTGNEALEEVTVMDSLLGDLSGSFGDTLAVGASESHEFDFTVPEDGADPLVNVVDVSGTGADSGTTVTSTANCSVDILHPAISIVKTVSEDTVAVGDTVTYTFVVKNTGDTTLFDISVDDDVLGHIGDIDVLEPGDSATLTADFVVTGDAPITNVAIARGHDILGRVVEASDTAVVTPILPTVVTTPPPPTTPFTGSDAGRLGLIAALALGIGLTVVAATTRRRRSGETT